MISLRQVSIYDTKANKWYDQSTRSPSGIFPIERYLFCAVVVSAPDNSSHNIYIYGGWPQPLTGYPGPKVQFALDDVWVLTVPSFQWISLGSTQVPRGALACSSLQNRYIVTYGGYPTSDYANTECDMIQSGLRLYDMKTSNWTSQFEYSTVNTTTFVPSAVYDVIGGSSSGGATITAPLSGFDNQALSTIFSQPSSSAKSKPQVGVIVAGVIGAFVGISLITGVAALVRRKMRRSGKDVYVNDGRGGDAPEVSENVRHDQSRPELSGNSTNELDGYSAVELEGFSRIELVGCDIPELDGAPRRLQ